MFGEIFARSYSKTEQLAGQALQLAGTTVFALLIITSKFGTALLSHWGIGLVSASLVLSGLRLVV